MIEIRNLNKTYDRKTRNANHVLHDISLTLPETGFVCIVGTSGCGKTSLLNAVGGLDTFDNGTVSIGKTTVSRSGTRAYEQERNNNFSYIFQNYYLLADHSVAYNVYLGLHSLALSHKEKLARVREALEAVNMARFARRIVSELSGGQQQRVAIARALARRPKVIFADEPTGNLDEENTVNICTLLRRISKTSLVVMVTHEQNIARFFADRIITLNEGRIVSDETDWQRDTLSPNSSEQLYTGDFHSEETAAKGLNIRVLTQENALPVDLTIAILDDRIIIKTADRRTISVSKSEEAPTIIEGERPVITLEAMDNLPKADAGLAGVVSNPHAKAGKGLSFSMMCKEALRLIHGKNIYRRIAWLFLTAMTVLTIWILSDYLTVATVDPHDFIVSNSHVLSMEARRGEALPANQNYMLQKTLLNLYQDLHATGVDFEVMPPISTSVSYTVSTFPQLSDLSVELTDFSYAPIQYLDESTLIYGRMPENSHEIVVDRWVLDKSLDRDGVIQNGITDTVQLLGTKLKFFKKGYAPTIVGICDEEEPTVYLPTVAFACLGNMGMDVLLLSDLQQMYPGEYDDVILGAEECIVITNNAGEGYLRKIGYDFNTNSLHTFKIVDAYPIEGTYQRIVLSDAGLQTMMDSITMMNVSPYFYAPDMDSFYATLMETLTTKYSGLLTGSLTNMHKYSMAVYREAATIKANARMIVTISLIVLCMVMLYLLQRSCVQQRLGMIAVYRLLGIPGRKLLCIYTLETFLLSLRSILPAAAFTWLVIAVLNRIPDLDISMVMPWQAAILVGAATTLYYLLVSLLPVVRLLRLPPARLATKYDM